VTVAVGDEQGRHRFEGIGAHLRGAANRSPKVSRSVAETVSVRADPAPPPRAAIPEQLVLSSDRYGR
jgi:hypothetical protein